MAQSAYPDTASILRNQIREAVLDHEAFEQKIVPCVLSRCRATCCYDGVYLSSEEARGIEAMLKHPSFDSSGLELPSTPIVSSGAGKSLKTSTRLAKPGELAEDYPKHFPKTRCVFLDKEGRCGIQCWSMEQGRDPWFDKPLTCWLHPIVILPANKKRGRPVVTLVSPGNDPQKSEDYPGFASCTHCGRPDVTGIPASEALKGELEMLGLISGRNIWAELNASECFPRGVV